MRRLLFTILSALSLVLCLGTCALWVRSYWVGDQVKLELFVRHDVPRNYIIGPADVYHMIAIVSGRGQIAFISEPQRSEPVSQRVPLLEYERGANDVSPPNPDPKIWNRLGFEQIDMGPDITWINAPIWLLVLLAALPPTIWFLRRRRIRPGRCAVCGYDLRASPDRCPECGVVPAGKIKISN